MKQKITTLSLVGIVAAAGGFFYFSDFFHVKKVSVLRSSLDLPIEEIQLSMRELALDKNIFTVDHELLSEAVRVTRPDISRVEISKKLPSEIVVKVFKFPVVAMIEDGEKTIFLNENGYIAESGSAEKDTLRLTLGENFDFSDPAVRVADGEHLQSMREAKFYFEAVLDRRIDEVIYFPTAREFHLVDDSGKEFWIDFENSYKNQIDKITLAGESLPLDEIEYADLRIRNKIFWK